MTGGGSAKGAIFGWGDNGGTKSVTDCLYLMADGQNTDGLDLVRLSGGTVSVANSYKTTNAGSNGKYTYAYTTAPANLGDLVQDYGMLKAYENGILYNGTYYVAPATLTLADNADNSTTISNTNGYVANVTLNGRTLYKDGKWNTLCLPFSVTLSGSPLNGAVARPLTAASISSTTLSLSFGDAVTTLEAGTPYIIKWIADANYVDDDEHNIVSPVFTHTAARRSLPLTTASCSLELPTSCTIRRTVPASAHSALTSRLARTVHLVPASRRSASTLARVTMLQASSTFRLRQGTMPMAGTRSTAANSSASRDRMAST